MGYRNNELGYPADVLASRAIVEKGNFALIPPGGLVKNIIPGFLGCDVTILASPKIGATFVDYLVDLNEGARTETGFGGGGVETFAYVLNGSVSFKAGEESAILPEGGYVYCPADWPLQFENAQKDKSRIFLYKRRYKPVPGAAAHTVFGNIGEITPIHYEDMDDVLIYDLLPKDLGFDMNFHILDFKPGASHGYIETHVQEHGAYILSGEGIYNLDNRWIPVKKDDYIFMGAYSLQAAYGVGRKGSFSYLYSKDCNRDEDI